MREANSNLPKQQQTEGAFKKKISENMKKVN